MIEHDISCLNKVISFYCYYIIVKIKVEVNSFISDGFYNKERKYKKSTLSSLNTFETVVCVCPKSLRYAYKIVNLTYNLNGM